MTQPEEGRAEVELASEEEKTPEKLDLSQIETWLSATDSEILIIAGCVGLK